MNGTSLTPQEIKLNQLKEILPEVFAEGKVDWEKLKATLGEDVNFNNERYVLNWAGKSEAFKILQAPSSKTLVPVKSESINFDETENIFIEGENLEVLKVLQKSYFNKIKMIYIDPPYNTGNDSFIYPDKFSETKVDYEKRVGDKDAEGYMTKDGMFKKNSKENGQYHSNWMNMMYPRLFLAKNLLKKDGAIFISIDDNEVHNLRMMMNEVFGEENFVAQFVWQKKYSRDNRPLIGTVHEYILLYSKVYDDFKTVRKLLPPSEESLKVYKNPNDDPRGRWRPVPMSAQAGHATKSQFYEVITPTGVKHTPPKGRCWSITEKKFNKLNKEGKIYFGKDSNLQPNLIRYLDEIKGFVPWTWLPSKDVGHTDSAMKEYFEIMGKDTVFETPKPSTLIKHLMRMVLDDDDTILDFFSGTSTTAQALMELNFENKTNNHFLNVQLSEEIDGHEKYKSIADIAKERIRRSSNKILEKEKAQKEEKESEILFEGEKQDQKLDIGFKVLKLEDSNFKQWRQLKNKDAKALEEQMQLFIDPVAANATTENMVCELILKSGKSLNSKIEPISDFHLINNGELVFMLEKANQEIIDEILQLHPEKVIALDKLFQDNDQLKTNTVLQMKDAGIEFKTI
jgi:adenine-specific DNA-methyltransferase